MLRPRAAPCADASPRSNSATASLNKRASVSGSSGKPARIHSASRARSVWPTRGPPATPRAIRSAPLNGSLGSGVSARNRSAAAKAASGRGAPDWASASASASRAASRPAVNRSARSASGGGGAAIPCRPTSRVAADLSRSYSALASRRRSRSRSASSAIATPSAASRRIASGAAAAIRLDRDQAAEPSGVGEAAEDRLEEAALAHRLDDLAGAPRRDELQEFGAHALPRQAREAVAGADRSGQTHRVETARGEAGREAEKAQNAQIILANALIRVADEAHASGGEIVESADRIVDRSVSSERERIDGEVAPLGVGDEVASERHLGPAPVGLDVLAQGRRLDRAPLDDDRHRAVGDAGERDLEPRRPRAANDFVGRGGGREVEIERSARRARGRAPPRRRGASPRLRH